MLLAITTTTMKNVNYIGDLNKEMKPVWKFLTIDGKEINLIGKLCPLILKNRRRWKFMKLRSKLFIYRNEDGTEGDLQPIPEDSDEWDMIEEVPHQLYGGVKTSGGRF